MCGLQFDDSSNLIPFIKPQITSPVCTDTKEIWNAWLVPTEAFDARNFKVSIDLENRNFVVTGHSGKTSGDITYTVYF